MTADQAIAALAGAAVGAGAAVSTAKRSIERASPRLMRTNFRGAAVPAVLGLPVAMGSLLGYLWSMLLGDLLDAGIDPNVGRAVVLTALLLAAGGYADDVRGDEQARGFRGHLREAFRGRVTGGLVKILAGAVAGVVAGLLVASGRAVLEIALLVALGANLVNLLDRAPGRASKVSWLAAAPLMFLGPAAWVSMSAGFWGAVLGTLPSDLREKGMLGDAGANPIGGVLGLGLGLTLGEPGRLIALVVLLALNLASEKWSYSKIIENNRALRAVDRLGRS